MLKRGNKCKAEGDRQPLEIVVPEFGYKTHVNRHGLIRRWAVSDAAAHDGHRLQALLDKSNTAYLVCADTRERAQTSAGSAETSRR
jgi:IS5 family transposase